MAWNQLYDGYWYNDNTGEFSEVDPATDWYQFAGQWYNRGTGASSSTNPNAPTPEQIRAEKYSNPALFGFGGQTKNLLDAAARAQGIDPTSMDWTPYAESVANAMGSATGSSSGGWMLGANDAYIANLILREVAQGTVAGKTDPRFAAKATTFAPDATGDNGYYNKDGTIYQQLEQAGIGRDETLRKDSDYSQLDGLQTSIEAAAPIALAMAAGPLSGLLQGATGLSPLVSNALTSAGSSLLTGGDPLTGALSSLASGGLSGLMGGDLASGAAAGYDLGMGGAINPMVEAASGYGAVGGGLGIPSGSMINLADSTQFIPALESLLAAPTPAPVTTPYVPTPAPASAPVAAPDMTGFQTPYTPPTFGQEAIDTSSFLTPEPTPNPLVDPAAVTGTAPYSGPAPFQTPYTAPFEQAVTVTPPAATTAPSAITPPTTPSMPELPGWVAPAAAGAGLAAGLEGTGGSGNTVTSGGDVDLTGVGTAPNPYNVDPAAAAAEKAAAAAATAASNSAISRILAGTATADDWAKVAGQAMPGLIGAYASNQQTNALKSLADRYAEYGAPSRARYEASYAPGFDLYNSDPAYKGALDQTSDSLLRRLSATGGNPFGNPGGLIEANKQIVAGTALPQLNTYRNQNANTGGLGALAAAYPQTQNAATASGSNVWNALGGAASDVLNPKPQATSLADIYKLINSGTRTA